MFAYVVRRILTGIIVLLVVSMLVFGLMRLLPGDPVCLYVGTDFATFTSEQLEEIRHDMGLDRPLVVQYFDWLGGILTHGDLGKSILYDQHVSSMIGQAIPITMHLAITALIFGSILGVLFGTICAVRRGRWPDTLFSLLGNIGITLPVFWVGIMLIYVFSYKLGLFPIYGYTSPFTDFWLSTKSIVLPVFCLSIFTISSLTRQTRSSMLEVTRQDYIRTAWAKGLKERIVVSKHVIRGGLIPVITTIGMHVTFMLGGSVLIETVFSIPGMGRLLKDAAVNLDYPVVQGTVLVIATFIVVVNIVVDIIYAWADPRIRLS